MEAGTLRFYLDENMPLAIARELNKFGIDVVTVRDIGKLGDSDLNHFRRAAEQGRVICTSDTDFLRMAAAGFPHAGIVFGQENNHSIGIWISRLRELHQNHSAADMWSHVEYL